MKLKDAMLDVRVKTVVKILVALLLIGFICGRCHHTTIYIYRR